MSYPPLPPLRPLGRLARRLPLLLALLPLAVPAGNFGVSPIRVELGPQARTGAITVSNDDPGPLRTQLRLAEWTQDAGGRDVYTPSEELLFFPRLITMEREEQRLVRVGLRQPPAAQEKAYRLFIEELPPPPEPGESGSARVSIAVSFGVPVFVRPADERPAGTIERMELAGGKLHVRVRNTGNVHFMIRALKAHDEAQRFGAEAAGWYLLAGAARDHVLPIDAGQCAGLRRLAVTVDTDRLALRGELPIDPARCGD